MLSASVVLDERLLMEVSHKSILCESLFQYFHDHHIVVDRLACILEQRAELELISCYFFMSCFAWHSDL